MNGEDEGKDLIITTISGTELEPTVLAYPLTTPSGTVVRDSTSYVGVDIAATAPDYYEAITETIERSRGFFQRGFKIELTLPDFLSGASVKFEQKPRTETKKTEKIVYRTPKK